MTPRRKLGPWMCIALVIGNMVGSGAFLLPADLAPLGWNSVYGWIVTIAGTLCLTVALTRLARDLPGGGCGPFTYPAAAFGRGVGFVVAWSYWISIWVTNAVLSVAVVRNLSIVWPRLAEPAIALPVAVGTIWLFTLTNCRGVRAAGGVQIITTALKLLPLAGAIAAGAWLVGSGTAAPAPHDVPPITGAGISAAATLTLFAMLGFESAMVAGERVENPHRIIPRATLIGVAITGAIYLFACSAVTLLLPAGSVSGSNAPFALFFADLVHPALGPPVAIFAAIAALGAINGFVLLQGELPLSMVRGGLLPHWAGAQNRYEAPWLIHIVSSGLATALVMVNFSRGLAEVFQFMVLVTTSTTIIFYVAGTLAAMKLSRGGRIAGSPGFLAIGVAGLIYALWAFYGAGIEASLWSLVMTAAAMPVYWLMRRPSPAAADAAAAPPGSGA